MSYFFVCLFIYFNFYQFFYYYFFTSLATGRPWPTPWPTLWPTPWPTPCRFVPTPLILTEPPSKLRKWRRRKRIVVFQNTDSRFSRKNNVFHLSSVSCKQRNRCCNYRRRSTTKIKVFAPGGREKFSQNFAVNSPPKNKCRFAIPHEQNNSFHLNLTSCKHRHRYYF